MRNNHGNALDWRCDCGCLESEHADDGHCTVCTCVDLEWDGDESPMRLGNVVGARLGGGK